MRLNIKNSFATWQVKRLLVARLPNVKAKEENIIQLLPEALTLRRQGLDFNIEFQKEEGHYEKVKDEVVRTESGPDGQEISGYGEYWYTGHFASGKVFTWHSTEEMDPDFKVPEEWYDKWIVDSPEYLHVTKGRRL